MFNWLDSTLFLSNLGWFLMFSSLILQMPRIWLDFCHFLTDQCRITRTRQVFDRALRALPITQHHRIWPLYLGFMKKHDIPETAVRVFRRYLKVGTVFDLMTPWFTSPLFADSLFLVSKRYTWTINNELRPLEMAKESCMEVTNILY